jgi:Uma2 family endonuclease
MAPQTSKLTYEDYALLPEDGLRHEIIDGEHYVNPAPNTQHQIVSFNVAFALRAYVKPRGLGSVFIAPYDVVLSDTDVVQPDVLFVSTAQMARITAANLQGAPDLAVEVLSPSNRHYDEVVKRKRYDALGVAEYWVVDPERATVRVHRRDGGLVRVETDDPLTTPLIPGFSVTLAEIFDPL